MSQSLAGSVAIVTGCSSGLGEQFARTLAAAGAKVGLLARRGDRLERLSDEIVAAGGTAMPLAIDVADADALPDAVSRVERSLGLIDILVNNAGVGDVALLVEQDVAVLDRMYAVNLRAPLVLSREVAKRLIAVERPGRIVNISSMAAFSYTGNAPCAAYAATKSALVRLTETLAVEWSRHRINVNAIAPGFFRSEMSATALEGREDEIVARMPRRRMAEPSQLDATLLYLVHSDVVTGTCILVDDGQMTR